MIVSFYDKNFKGLQNNASLVVAKDSYELIKRPIETNSLTCKCEPFTEDIQPTFLVIQNDRGGYVYGCLAGIPELNKDNQTEINGTDLKSMLSCDIILTPQNYVSSVNNYINYLFAEYIEQVPQPFTIELQFKDNVGTIELTDLLPISEKNKYNMLDELSQHLKYYNLYLDSEIDLINKKVIFIVGKMMYRNLNVKLWDYGVQNYGKWIADINECQGYYEQDGVWTAGYKWILTSNNQITTDESLRDIYPIKKSIVVSNESLEQANKDALSQLLESLYNENIKLNADDILKDSSFETNFAIYLKQGEGKYKDLPCGELQYNDTGLTKIQIGFRYVAPEFII